MDTGVNDAFFNMAVDEALLILSQDSKRVPVLRVYTWSPWAVSVGYFQPIRQAVDMDLCQKYGIDIVRRITGGRAVFHFGDLTYSVCASTEGYPSLGQNVNQTYQLISKAFLRSFGLMGLHCQWVRPQIKKKDKKRNNEKNPILFSNCFASQSRYEIILQGKKLVGSAQRRWGKSFIQQGSIQFEGEDGSELSIPVDLKQRITKNRYIRSEKIASKKIVIKQLKMAMRSGFSDSFKVNFQNSSLSDEEVGLAEELRQSKYEKMEWNYRV